MVQTRGYANKEEATEAWNTWAGGNRTISRNAFNRLNESVERDYPIKDGKLAMPDGEHAFGDVVIDPEGGYEHPWPRIRLADYANSEQGLYGADDMFMVYKLRARWRLIEHDHKLLREHICELLSMNDRDNNPLNEQLEKWNGTLADSGFPTFEKNDLRGIDLSGLSIAPQGQPHVWLRQVDLSYSECHLLQLQSVNMYGARCIGMHATQIDLRYATAHGTVFRCCYMPDAQFAGADIGDCDFRNALLSHSVFDGSNCHGTDFSSANLWKASFDSHVDQRTGKRVFTDLSDVEWDEDTRFSEVLFNNFLPEQNKALYDFICTLRSPTTVKDHLVSSVEMKPGIFGFSLDLAKVFSGCRAALKQIGRKTQQDKSSVRGKSRR